MYKGIESLTKSLNQISNATMGLYHNTFVGSIPSSVISATQAITASLAQSIKPNVCNGIAEAVAGLGNVIQPAYSEYMQSSLTRAYQTLAESMIHTLRPEIYTGLSETFQSVSNTLHPMYMDVMKNLCSDVCVRELSGIASSMSDLVKGIPDVSFAIADVLSGIDWSKLRIDEETASIECDGETYQVADIEKIAIQCHKEIKNAKDRTELDNILNKNKIISFLISLLIGATISPIVSNGAMTAWEENKFYIADALSQSEQVGYVTADEVSVKVSHSSHSSEICKLLYGDSVVITDSVPYWYKVKVRDADGVQVEGYVAKRNIEYKVLKFF